MTTSAYDERTAFLAAIRADPDCDVTRVAFADWLDEHPEDVCPECVGRGETHDAYPGGWSRCDTCHGTGRVPNRNAARAEFIRVQCELANGPACELAANCGGLACAVWNASVKAYRAVVVCQPCRRFAERRRRELELGWPKIGNVGDVLASDIMDYYFARGFVERVRLPWGHWLAHHAAILAHPDVVLRRVELTTWPDDDWYSGHGDQSGLEHGITRQRLHEAELVVITRMWLSRDFPGHCRYEEDGRERFHPIEWVLPGENDRTGDVTNAGVPCDQCSGTGKLMTAELEAECDRCGGTGSVAR